MNTLVCIFMLYITRKCLYTLHVLLYCNCIQQEMTKFELIKGNFDGNTRM